MRPALRRSGGLLAMAWLLGSAGSAPPAPPLRLIDHIALPSGAIADGYQMGGISGIDRDPRDGRWYLISDDRSQHGPAHFFVATIDYDIDRPLRLVVEKAVPLLSETGATFPMPGTGREASDGESIRVDPDGGRLIWSSEGDAGDGFGPAMRTMKRDGSGGRVMPLPGMFAFDPAGKSGPRPNLSIEGLTFAPVSKALWFSLEAPLFQDGPVASARSGADIRLTRLAADGTIGAQYAYPLGPIGPVPPGRLADNGVSEILAIDDTHLLVLERSGQEQDDHDFRYHVRLYCADLARGSDIRALPTLAGASYRAVAKHLVLDFATLPAPRVDNVEGMGWGQTLSNGHASLVFATDNDFSPHRATQFLAFELNAGPGRAARVHALCRS
jgi:hypothetical protein